MEPNTIYAERQGNLVGEVVNMSVDEASMAHVMSILTDLYSNPTLAVVREYSTNALDAHREAGVDKPIEVSTPNALSPFFKVKDYGVGLSVEDIRNIYSKYGASTKRSTNDQVGMLGLGCKSALTYSQQFTVRSVKDGELVIVSISRTETGAGEMTIVHTSPTDEPNGVEIAVPVERHNDFHATAEDFFRFWEPGTVLLNGVEPEYISGMKLSDNITILETSSTDFVVMGNVAYRVNNSYSLYNGWRGYNGLSIVAKVPIGSVDFTPSREDLHYTKTTIATLDRARDEVAKLLVKRIQEEVNAAETAVEARKISVKWKGLVGGIGNLTYKGEHIPTDVDGSFIVYVPDSGRYSTSTMRLSSMDIRSLENVLLIQGFDGVELTSYNKSKIRLWQDQNRHSGLKCIVTNEPVEQKWFENNNVVEWEEVKAAKKPREEKDKETFSVLEPGSYYYKNLTEIPDKTIVLFTGTDERVKENMKSIINLAPCVAVNLAKNRWAKFKREHKNVVSVEEFLDSVMQKAYDSLTDDDKLNMSMDEYERSSLNLTDHTRFDDPELARYARVASLPSYNDNIAFFRTVRNVMVRCQISVDKRFQCESMKTRYPLLSGLNSRGVDHFYIYANIIYKSEVNNA